MTLEERIRQLMEGQNQKSDDDQEVKLDKEGNPIVNQDQDDSDESEKDDDSDDDSDDKDETEFSKDKNSVKVNEEATNDKLKAGAGKKEAGGKLPQPPQGGDKKDDNGDNARLTVGKGRKDGEGAGVKGPGASIVKKGGDNESNARNNVDQQSLQTKPFKITVGEHIEAMFKGQELSEEFVQNASVIFEAAVNTIVEERLSEEVEALQEEFQTQLEEAVDAVQSELVENIDGFLNAVVEQWVEENKLAVESGIKVEMVTNFIDGMKTLFKESYIEVPEDKLDVVEEQAAKIEELKQALVVIDEAHDAAVAETVALKKEKIVEQHAKGMTEVQKSKFVGLCEGLEFSDEDDFSNKVKVVKESYFSPETKKAIQESVETKATTPLVEGVMSKYVEVLKNPLKF